MTKYFSEQRGAALVLVLFIITLMLIFSTILLYHLNTSVAQFDKMEAVIQSESAAEMGVEYYRAHVEKMVNEAEGNRFDKALLEQSLNRFEKIDLDDSTFVEIDLTSIEERTDSYIITFRVKGTAHGNESVLDDQTITISF
ncbi:hypothetical protein [Sediminibacillus massiliensis]|uniref:hypothetical protein n=1 Tax=Sediminibacillus massiliensis TaxID=1926277 RepID=UPI000988424E|nr:hypothetical protein [Sediminibacillus massiliensis]